VSRGADGAWTLDVRTLKMGVAYRVTLPAPATVAELKVALAGPAGLPLADQRLVCAGTALLDTQPLQAHEARLKSAPLFVLARPALAPIAEAAAEATPAPAAPVREPPMPAAAVPPLPSAVAAMEVEEDAGDDAAFWSTAAAYFERRLPPGRGAAFTAQVRQQFDAARGGR